MSEVKRRPLRDVDGAVLFLTAAYTLLLFSIKLSFFCKAVSWLLVSALGWLALALFLEVVHWYAAGMSREWRCPRRLALCGSAGLVAGVLVIFWFLPPAGSENLLGSSDEGIYNCTALHLQRTRSYEIEAAFVSVLPETMRELVVEQKPAAVVPGDRSPALYSYFDWGFRYVGKTRLAPHFPPGYPGVLAAWLDVRGWRGLGELGRMITMLSALAMTVMACRGWGRWLGRPVLFLALFLPLQFWISRMDFAEGLLQFLWVLAALLFCGRRRNFPSVMAGVFLCGLLLSVKLDALLAVLVVAGVMFFGKNRHQSFLYRIGLAAGFLIAVGSGWPGTVPYIRETLHPIVLQARRNWGIVAGIFVLAGCWRFFKNTGLVQKFSLGQALRRNELALPTAVLVFAYAYWLRPVLGPPAREYFWLLHHVARTFNEENFVRLGWYFTLPGLFAASTGMVLVFQGCRQRLQGLLPTVGLLSLLLVTARINCNPLQPYVMRRYVPFALPLLIMGLAAFPVLGGKVLPRWVRPVWLLWPVLWGAIWWPGLKEVLPVSNMKGLAEVFRGTVEALPEHSFLVISENAMCKRLKMPFFVGFGVPTVEFYPQANRDRIRDTGLFEALEKNGYQAIWLTSEQSKSGSALNHVGPCLCLREFSLATPDSSYARPRGTSACKTYRWVLTTVDKTGH